ncbi:MAG: hypothetical protein ED556_08545 [Winogradskyella sp.]|uniref:hypothetical protein n=1 Tax=Winogradskyella sp. TaxID=1883156 RepID=UPI000F3B70E2|nr:hypothetical protein [Winogradskyella sp.]RNC86333.1 MAG: hypothetical protein ED556_08545 [Winogradskyella sp.]
MTSSDLKLVFSEEITFKHLKSRIDVDVQKYEELMKIKGSYISLNFNDDENIDLSTSDLRKLLLSAKQGILSNVHVAYICDCLTLSENINYENQQIQNIVFDLADPEINGGFKTNAELESIIAAL